ncbi:hypothetical protein MKW98_021101 [Papaver atlanticum]|uniref:FBD domain-containing protein n=1 Tax=Papaver atlanticum TaxID=357466 RepID=A0AAD4TA45_9MAGN|nr:hypothetical protein MKW98_021101 [Papaver atlanticum]
MSTDYSLQNIYSTVIADISVTSVRKNEDAPELPVGVKELLNFVSCILEKLDTRLPRYQNLKCIKLETSLSPDSLNAITYLLKLTPNIESIEVKITQHYIADAKGKLFQKPVMCPYFDEVNSAVESYWKTKLSLPSMLRSLKSVKILGVQGLINELMLLELLLKSYVALEQVVVESCTLEQCRESNPHLSKRRMKKFSETLLKLPRAAATISILFNIYI